MKITTINRLRGFLVLSFLALVCIATSVKAQAAHHYPQPAARYPNPLRIRSEIRLRVHRFS